MLLLLGTRRIATVLLTVVFVCGQCGTRATQTVVREQQRITVFFIPLLSIGTRWAVECSHCGIATSLTRQQAEHSQQWAAANGLAA